MTVGVVIAVVAASVSIATFTDTHTGNIGVEAGTVQMALNDENLTEDVTLAFTACADETNMGPGDACDYAVEITNMGSLYFSLGIGSITETGDLNNCFTAAWVSGDEPQSGLTDLYAPAEVSTGTIRVTLGADVTNACQAGTAAYEVVFTATYAAAP